MKVVGVFRELEPRGSDALPSIHDARDLLPVDLAQKVARYLRRGEPVFDVMEFTRDPFDTSKIVPGGTRLLGVSGGPTLLTDGQWTWRQDLAYYVEKYRVAISNEFIEHALSNNIDEMDRAAAIANGMSAVDAYELAIS
jgi:hypothetical protein